MDRPSNVPVLPATQPAKKNAPSLWQLRVFETVARLENVTRASHELLRSQPATTSCIGSLEAELGATLFERSTTGVYLTPVGIAVLVRARKILAAAEEAVREVAPDAEIAPLSLATRITRTQMRCLIAIAECKSFRTAARVLGITEASLQRAARMLEQNLGGKIYRHTACGITTSDVGEVFAVRLKGVSAQIRSLTEAIAAYEFPRERCVTIGVMLLDPTILIVNAIRQLNDAFPDARVVVVSGTYDTLLNKVLREELDFSIGILKHPDAAFGFVEEPLYRERYCVVSRRDHPLMRKPSVSLEDLSRYRWVLPPRGSPRREAYEHIFAEGVPPPALIETYSLSTIRITLSDTDMLTVLSWTEVLSERRFGFLSALPVDVPWSEPIVGITRLGEWQPNELQDAFLASLRRSAASITGLGS